MARYPQNPEPTLTVKPVSSCLCIRCDYNQQRQRTRVCCGSLSLLPHFLIGGVTWEQRDLSSIERAPLLTRLALPTPTMTHIFELSVAPHGKVITRATFGKKSNFLYDHPLCLKRLKKLVWGSKVKQGKSFYGNFRQFFL